MEIELTWQCGETTIKEICTLVGDDEEVVMQFYNQPIKVNGLPNNATVGDISCGMVMFEDEFGLFGLDPSSVIHIKELHR